MKSVLVLLLASLSSISGCKSKEKFPDLGNTLASPVDVAVSDSGQNFFVLNADMDRTYNQGSIIVLDKDGNKVARVLTPRMGRNLVVAGNDMLATYDFRDDDEGPLAQLYDITDPLNPVMKAEWKLKCSPFGAVMKKDYKYFAISCTGGQLWIGTLADDRSQTTLKWVRDFDTPRRALLIDSNRDLLFGFSSDPSQKTTADIELLDTSGWDDRANETLGAEGQKVPNEVPDEMESSRRRASDKTKRHIYQFFAYDLKAEADGAPECTVSELEDCKFPFRDQNDPVVQKELHWIYFKLQNFDGTPDDSANAGSTDYKYYRTNFWEAKPDPFDPNVFYLSHRGRPDKAPHANHIVRVTLIDDPRTAGATDKFMTFERVYGFKGEGVAEDGTDYFKFHYPGAFDIREVAGQKLLLVNHFRDLSNWVKGDRYFSIGAQVLDDLSWFTEVRGELSASNVTTYYQIAMNGDGRAISCSFYGNAVILMQATPGIGLEVVKRVD